jgi:hypothetical protein
MHEQLALIRSSDREMEWGLVDERLAEFRKDSPLQWAHKGGTVKLVFAIQPGDVDEDFAIGAAKNEPGIAFIRNATVGLQRQSRLQQSMFNSVEFRRFLGGPIPRPFPRAKQADYLGNQNRLRDGTTSER